METTALRDIDRAWQIARKDDTLAALLNARIGNGNRREQRFGLRMFGREIQLIAISQFYDFAQVHHCDTIGHVAHNAQVV